MCGEIQGTSLSLLENMMIHLYPKCAQSQSIENSVDKGALKTDPSVIHSLSNSKSSVSLASSRDCWFPDFLRTPCQWNYMKLAIKADPHQTTKLVWTTPNVAARDLQAKGPRRSSQPSCFFHFLWHQTHLCGFCLGGGGRGGASIGQSSWWIKDKINSATSAFVQTHQQCWQWLGTRLVWELCTVTR